MAGHPHNTTPEGDYGNQCPEHNKKFSLFCLSDTCMRPLCSKCVKGHRSHIVADLEDAASEIITMGKDNLNKMKMELADNAEKAVARIEMTKRKVIKELDKRKEFLLKEKKKRAEKVSEKLSLIHDNEMMLRDMKQKGIGNPLGLTINMKKNVTAMMNDLKGIETLENKDADELIKDIRKRLSEQASFRKPNQSKAELESEINDQMASIYLGTFGHHYKDLHSFGSS